MTYVLSELLLRDPEVGSRVGIYAHTLASTTLVVCSRKKGFGLCCASFEKNVLLDFFIRQEREIEKFIFRF